MFMCFVNWYSVINLDIFWKQSLPFTCAEQNLWKMLPTLNWTRKNNGTQILWTTSSRLAQVNFTSLNTHTLFKWKTQWNICFKQNGEQLKHLRWPQPRQPEWGSGPATDPGQRPHYACSQSRRKQGTQILQPEGEGYNFGPQLYSPNLWPHPDPDQYLEWHCNVQQLCHHKMVTFNGRPNQWLTQQWGPRQHTCDLLNRVTNTMLIIKENYTSYQKKAVTLVTDNVNGYMTATAKQ